MVKVSIIMGSESDMPKMRKACEVLNDYGVDFDTTIVSAHRTPIFMSHFALNARDNGIQVIIAGAGGAAHLPGMVASYTLIPVIGVPLNRTAVQGKDALYSIVQMPAGIPVATVGIDNSHNAALLALQILSLNDNELYDRLMDARRDKEKTILEAKLNWSVDGKTTS